MKMNHTDGHSIRRLAVTMGRFLVVGLVFVLAVACRLTPHSVSPDTTLAAETPATLLLPTATPRPAMTAPVGEGGAEPAAGAIDGAAPTALIVETALQMDGDLPIRQGVCLARSEIVPSLSAWRCRPGADNGAIVDPCLQQADGTLICDPAGDAFALALTSPLPAVEAPAGQDDRVAWRVTLPDPADERAQPLTCLRDLTPESVGGRPVTFVCPQEGAERIVLLGEPQRDAVWTVSLARLAPDGDTWQVVAESVATLSEARIYISPLDVAHDAGLVGTQVITYVPMQPGGPVQEGACWTNSLAVSSAYAWRCMVGDSISDPCFEIPSQPDRLVCEPDPLTDDPGFALQLAEPLPLPEGGVGAAGGPWLLELADGSRCGIATGATGAVDGERIGYLCTAEPGQTVGLVGRPASGMVTGAGTPLLWSARRAVLVMGDQGMTATEIAWVPVRAVVLGPQAYAPLDCSGLARDVAPLLGTSTTTSTVGFYDYVRDEGGAGCRVEATGDGADFANPVLTVDLLRDYLFGQGWEDDWAYVAGGPTGEAAGFRNDSGLCLVDVEWTPREGACPTDQLISACNPAPEDQAYTVRMTCTSDVYGGAVPTGGYALGLATPQRLEFPPGETRTAWQGVLDRGQVDRFIFRAREGQRIHLEIVSTPPGVVGISIVGAPDGTPLLSPTTAGTAWSATLSSSQDYVMRIAVRESATYTATLEIPPGE